MRNGDLSTFCVTSGTVGKSRNVCLMPDNISVVIVGVIGYGCDFTAYHTAFHPHQYSHLLTSPPTVIIPHILGSLVYLTSYEMSTLRKDHYRRWFYDVCGWHPYIAVLGLSAPHTQSTRVKKVSLKKQHIVSHAPCLPLLDTGASFYIDCIAIMASICDISDF